MEKALEIKTRLIFSSKLKFLKIWSRYTFKFFIPLASSNISWVPLTFNRNMSAMFSKNSTEAATWNTDVILSINN